MPQIADGADWRTAIVLTNTTSATVTANLTFFQDTSAGATVGWTPPFVEMSNTQSISIPAASTVFLHTTGTATQLSQGWGQLTGAGVVGYAIYTYGSYAGRPDQDGTSEAVPAANRILVPFDNTNGFITSLAIVNPTIVQENVSVNIRTEDGTITNTSLSNLPPDGQLAFLTADQFPATKGHRGLAEFYILNGAISIAAFRFNPTLALTSSPVYPQASASPIIGIGTSGPLPQFLRLAISATRGINGQSQSGVNAAQVLLPNPDGSYSSGYVSGFSNFGTISQLGYSANWTRVTVNGQIFTFSAIDPSMSSMSDSHGNIAPITSATMTVTLTPDPGQTSGSATGTVSLSSTLGTVNESFIGGYLATLK